MTDKITFNVTRRRITEVLMGLVALFLASGATATILKYLWPQASKHGKLNKVKIVSVDEMQVGDTKMFKFGDEPKAAILLRIPDGFRAYGAVCTHLGCIVNKKISEMNMIFCPCHAGMYDLSTGKVLAGPPPSRLPGIDIVEEDGAVFAVKWKDPDYVRTLSMYAGAA